MATSSVARGSFLANNNYSIDGGLLAQPQSVYELAQACGEPVASFERASPSHTSAGEGSSPSSASASSASASPWALRRAFEHGSVQLDLQRRSASIDCGSH